MLELVEMCRTVQSILLDIDTQSMLGKKRASSLATEVRKNAELRIKAMLESLYDPVSVYGDEYGFNIQPASNNYWIIDSLDGVRLFERKLFYSAISIGHIVDGLIAEGILVRINNQQTRDFRYEFYVVKKDRCALKGNCRNGKWRWIEITDEPIAEAINLKSLTSDMSFVEGFRAQWPDSDWQNVIEKEAMLRTKLNLSSICCLQFMSGANSILEATVEKDIGVFVNLCATDLVSHPVALLIAETQGFPIGHVFSDGNDFSIEIKDGKPRFRGGDGSIVVAANQNIFEEVMTIINSINFPKPLRII